MKGLLRGLSAIGFVLAAGFPLVAGTGCDEPCTTSADCQARYFCDPDNGKCALSPPGGVAPCTRDDNCPCLDVHCSQVETCNMASNGRSYCTHKDSAGEFGPCLSNQDCANGALPCEISGREANNDGVGVCTLN
jgi:hypothetical protein